MTNEEAIKAIQSTIVCFGRTNGKTQFIKATDVAIAALEKQIPLKPKIYTREVYEGKAAHCPVCDGSVDWTYNGFWRHGKVPYCKDCGQAIDWREVKE